MMPTRAVFAAATLARGHEVAAAKIPVPPTSLMICLRSIALVPGRRTRLAHYLYRATRGPKRARRPLRGNAVPRPITMGYLDDPCARRERVDQRISLGLVCGVEIGIPFVEQINFGIG